MRAYLAIPSRMEGSAWFRTGAAMGHSYKYREYSTSHTHDDICTYLDVNHMPGVDLVEAYPQPIRLVALRRSEIRPSVLLRYALWRRVKVRRNLGAVAIL